MKLIDTTSGVELGNIITNHSMSIDEALELLWCTVDEDGEILNENGEPTNAWYDDLKMQY